MKYRILKGTTIFDDLSAIKTRIDEIDKMIRVIVNELGADEWLAGGSGVVAGNLSGIRFAEKPEGWKLVQRYMAHGMYFPKVSKQNKKLLDRIYAIPSIKRDELNDIVGFKRQWVGLTQYNSIGVTWGDEFHLVYVSEETTYSPLPDMEELKDSEYRRLYIELTEARKEVFSAD